MAGEIATDIAPWEWRAETSPLHAQLIIMDEAERLWGVDTGSTWLAAAMSQFMSESEQMRVLLLSRAGFGDAVTAVSLATEVENYGDRHGSW